MSVQCNQYIGYGYLLDFKQAQEVLVKVHGEEGYEELADKYHDNAFNTDIVEVYGCSMIEDGMNADYTFFGKIYAKTKNYEPFESMSIPEPSERDKIIVEHEFNRLFDNQLEVDPSLQIIAHYR